MKTRLRSLTGAREIFLTLGLATLLCGVADIAFALVRTTLSGGSPVRLLQSIAYSVLGRDTYAGGLGTAALGLLLHFGVAAGAAVQYAAVANFCRPAVRHPLIAGVLFGVYFHLLMHFVVLPLTLIPSRPYFQPFWWMAIVAHTTCVGPMLALALSYREQRLAPTGHGAEPAEMSRDLAALPTRRAS